MGNDLAVREHVPQTNVLTAAQLKYIAHTEFVPVGLRGKENAILACVATGRALGIDDMTALRSIHIIEGKATFSAELMVQLVRRRGHSIQGNFSGDSCTVTGKRVDNGDEMTVTWTKEMAQEAGLLNKDNYRKYRPAMLWARAVSQLCRMLFADCFAGSTHTPEEISDGDFEEMPDALSEPGMVDSVLLGPDEGSAAETEPEAPLPGSESASAAQLKKLNVLVGTLRDAGKITTEDVYGAVGRDPVLSEDGELHWSPLRDSLTKEQASTLIEQLEAFELPAGLSVADLKAQAKTAGIPLSRVGVACQDLFGHQNVASGLTDIERAAVWAQLETEVVGA